MERGEVWWAMVGDRCPVVLLCGTEESELRAMQIVAPATAQQKQGFVVLSATEAADPAARQQAISLAGADVGGVGIEVEIGTGEGLTYDGVVRVAIPHQGRIFCTWLVTLTRESLVKQAGALSTVKLEQLANALRLAELE
ncbi:hypothetical protein Rhe02_16830 [Rhizocola hellebori]|uniref:Type II toxin-antitoxin system PemK/MazF family toxin n=1 Tax=Rhizocola hellebori TaxID=1392758 RepID=A0A8J3Q4M1_9ACTN|nr:hypothetical protein [Rhizocola hellebori]GIH03616.1 hypothetical protein Rhe02_16830 [Rhizocola hellebori]